MMRLIVIAAAAAAPAGDWKFVDDGSRGGRSVVTFRTVELADTPARPLDPADRPPPGAKFGAVALGPGGRHRLGVVWHAAAAALWFDADGDGRYAAAERVTLGASPHEARLSVPFGDGLRHDRTVLVRKRADGLAWAVRGYTTGTVALNGRAVVAMLTDGDADGCFDGAGADRVWLDLDGDGRFDPLAEQYPLGTAIPVRGSAVLVRPRPDGLAVRARDRPAEAGTLAVDLVRLPRAEVVELSATYVSEFGELVVVPSVGKPVSVPCGRYRVESLRFKLADADGRVWRYTFSPGDPSPRVNVAKGAAAVHRLLDGLTVEVAITAGRAAPGGLVTVQPDVGAGGLYLTGCEVGGRFAEHGREVPAEIALAGPGSAALDRCDAGFL
jgi:hypothetical protein